MKLRKRVLFNWFQPVANLTPKAFANSSLGQRPRGKAVRNLKNAEGVREMLATHICQRFQRFGRSSLTIPGALPQARIGERLRRKFVTDASRI
jgi:hypothetical protein